MCFIIASRHSFSGHLPNSPQVHLTLEIVTLAYSKFIFTGELGLKFLPYFTFHSHGTHAFLPFLGHVTGQVALDSSTFKKMVDDIEWILQAGHGGACLWSKHGEPEAGRAEWFWSSIVYIVPDYPMAT